MNIVSYGGGANSTALLIGLHQHRIPVDLVLFADTGAEHPHTYAYLNIIDRWLKEHGMPLITRVYKYTQDGKRLTLEDECLQSCSLPSIAYGYKKCSLKHKIGPQEKFCNNHHACRKVWDSGRRVVKFVGYDAGEEHRSEKVLLRDLADPKYSKWYPLMEWGWYREDCIRAIEAAGLPQPGKSSCFFCPSNMCYYSGVTHTGQVTATYFPAMNEVAVDMSGSPVTGLVRHYSKLLVFKPDGTYTITYEPVTLQGGDTVAGFYLRSANRELGNDVMGQVQTVNNYPRTITKDGVYEWRITSSYYQDERYAKRISDRVETSIREADITKFVTCDDNYSKTYYIFLNDDKGTVLVNRYDLDKNGIWCIYRADLLKNVQKAMVFGGTMIFATDTDLFYFNEMATMDAPGKIEAVSTPIKAVWESGFMHFGADYRKKYSSNIYVSMLPESRSMMTITATTDRRDTYMEKILKNDVFSWDNIGFGSWTFNLSNVPKIRKVRLKVKKFVYYKLIFRVDEPGTRATVLGFDQQVRFSSMVK